MSNKVRVVVVDDSAFSRRTITRMLEEIDGVEVVDFATNGEEGIQKVITLKPDLVTLDLEMPRMDGFTLLRILATRFSVSVIVISALSGADKVFRALELGALDFIPKPSFTASNDLLGIKADLQRKVLQVVNHRPKDPVCGTVPLPQVPGGSPPVTGDPSPTAHGRHNRRPEIDLVAIGASTGGPPALQKILCSFQTRHPFAVVVSQHMPSGFTAAFAERLNRTSPFDIKEACDGDPVLPGRVLIAPGGRNLVLDEERGQVVVRVLPPLPADRYIPSVDVMLESCAPLYRERMIAIILTGMGNDGARGVRSVHSHGGHVIAESEETAVVYGMPREAVATGLVDKIVPLHRIEGEILLRCRLIA